MLKLFASPKGRIRRRHYWLAKLAVVAGIFVLMFVLPNFLSPSPPSATVPGESLSELMARNERLGEAQGHSPLGAITTLLSLALLYSSVVLDVKRSHDRNRSGLFVLLELLPIIGWVWVFVELGLLDGTPGPNRFGPSPKGLGPPAEAVV